MQIGPAEPRIDLTEDEAELVLKALGAFQIHLFDELTNAKGREAEQRGTLESQIRNVSNAIKKIHRYHESLKQ
jgi:hypothetical protein